MSPEAAACLPALTEPAGGMEEARAEPPDPLAGTADAVARSGVGRTGSRGVWQVVLLIAAVVLFSTGGLLARAGIWPLGGAGVLVGLALTVVVLFLFRGANRRR